MNECKSIGGCPEELLLLRPKGRKRYENTCLLELRGVVSDWFDYAQRKQGGGANE